MAGGLTKVSLAANTPPSCDVGTSLHQRAARESTYREHVQMACPSGRQSEPPRRRSRPRTLDLRSAMPRDEGRREGRPAYWFTPSVRARTDRR